MEDAKMLNVGCGRIPLEGWLNLDHPLNDAADVHADLELCSTEPLPFEDDTFDLIQVTHVLEHIHNILPLMQELHRVSKADGLLLAACPYGSSDDADEDPTHVRKMYPGSFLYFGQPTYWRADYGYRGDWKVDFCSLRIDKQKYPAWEHQGSTIEADIFTIRNVVHEIRVQMHAVKPIREWKDEMDQCPIRIDAVDAPTQEERDAARAARAALLEGLPSQIATLG